MAIKKQPVRLDIRMGAALHKKLKRIAGREKRSLNQQMVLILEKSIQVRTQA